MKTKPTARTILRQTTLAGLAIILFLSGCTFSLVNLPGLGGTTTPPTPAGPSPTPQPAASITFTVSIPATLASGEVLVLSVLDELTGLGLNPVNYPMQGMDATHYTVNIPFPLGSVVKYRYMRQGTLPTLEDTSADQPVRYRLVAVAGPSTVEDVVSSWADSPFNSPAGRITGQIVDSATNQGIADVLICAAGQQTLTGSDGKFFLEGVPGGTHNLAAFAIDGAYQVNQQGARVEAGKTTQVNLALKPAATVDVTFFASVPAKTIASVPIRLAGSYAGTGNTFGDLLGGLSTAASILPQLTPMADGRYSINLKLHAGMDFRYKYTLGDGFWNAEHNLDGSFTVRQIIVPEGVATLEIHDAIQTWQAGPASPILFEASVPANTPVGDIPSIQFNPYGWTEPIPMWPRGNNQWVYELYSPLNMLGEFEYRYCLNDQCGIADDVQTRAGQRGRPISTSLAPEDMQDTISSWMWITPTTPAAQVGLPVNARAGGFWAGVEFLPATDPTWEPWMGLAIQNIQSLSANWVVLSPTWTFRRTDPLVFSQVAGFDPLMENIKKVSSLARAANLNVALFPGANFPGKPGDWWKSAPRSSGWWDDWFSHYTEFVNYEADVATAAGAQALILGGEWLAPSLPGGVLLDGTPSGAPADATTRWLSILTQARQRFSGKILWAGTYNGAVKDIPDFASQFDGVYLLWHSALTTTSSEALYTSVGDLLDLDIQPLQTALGKPVIIAAAYSSSTGSASVSVPLEVVLQPGNTQLIVDLQMQADIYQALMRAINDRPWVGGFVSRGYYPPMGLQDGSASIHGKPAADVLWYWYPRMLGMVH